MISVARTTVAWTVVVLTKNNLTEDVLMPFISCVWWCALDVNDRMRAELRGDERFWSFHPRHEEWYRLKLQQAGIGFKIFRSPNRHGLTSHVRPPVERSPYFVTL